MWTVITIALFAGHIAAISVVVLFERRQPAATLAWLLTLVFLPVIGLLVYLVIGAPRIAIKRRRMELASQRFESIRERLGLTARLRDRVIANEDPRTVEFLKLGAALSSTAASQGNRATLLENASATYRAIAKAIENATDHIHVEFYIIQPDESGRRLRDRLIVAQERGVMVRVLVDAVGSSRLPSDFWDDLVAAGGQAAAFSPVRRVLTRFRRRDRVDFRNHRKIVVVDGCVGFTGGINIGREYLGLDPELTHWRDSHVELQGPCVLSLQSAFAEDWYSTTFEALEDHRYFPDPRMHDDDAIVQVIDSGPDREWASIETAYAFAIASARQRVWITNPYFIPSPVIENALVTAALRGVDVRVLLPLKSDNVVVQLAARSYFPPMIEAGAKVYRYARGFVHAKTMVVDDWLGTVGSANMDMRSFRLNFELNAFVLDPQFADILARSFADDLRVATEFTAEDLARQGLFAKFLTGAARLFSPLL